MNVFKHTAVCIAVSTILTGCFSSSDDNTVAIDCPTLTTTPEVIVKGNNPDLQRQTIAIGATGDMHGRIWAYDYALDRVDANAGFTKISTLLNEMRDEYDANLLIDLGDTVQGNSAELFNEWPVHPVVDTMNLMEYDVWVPGNHEFDFARNFLDRNLKAFEGAAISSNIVWDESAQCAQPEEVPFLRGHQIFDFNGAKVAVIGVTPSLVPNWQAANPANFKDLAFKNELDAVRSSVEQVINNHNPDVVIGALHYGRTDGGTGVREIAAKLADQFDVIFMGHEHAEFIEQLEHNQDHNGDILDISRDGSTLEDKEISGVYNASNRHEKVKVIEPGKWGWALAQAEIELEKDEDGKWQLVDTTLSNRRVNDEQEDVVVQEHTRDIHEESIEDANTVVGKVTGNFVNSSTGYADEATDLDYNHSEADASRLYSTIHHAKVADMPLVDLINLIQIRKAEEALANDDSIEFDKVHVSAAALFGDTANLVKGQDYAKKDSANLYMYDNKLSVVEITGENLLDFMEWSYSYFNTYQEGDLTVSFPSEARAYNYDLFDGDIRYSVDLSGKPRLEDADYNKIQDGERINIIDIAGESFDKDMTYVVAVNDYRYSTTMLLKGWATEDDLIWDSSNETVYAIRDMLTEYVVENNELSPEDFTSYNWYIEQYGQIDFTTGERIEDGVIPTLRAESDLWKSFVNQEICITYEDSRDDAINVSLNEGNPASWFNNPNYAEGATQEELHAGCVIGDDED